MAGGFDTDADADLAVANFADDTISVLTGAAGRRSQGRRHSPPATGRARSRRACSTRARTSTSPSPTRTPTTCPSCSGRRTPRSRTQVTYAAGDGPSGVAVGDFDQDFDPDLAVANIGDDDVSILRGATGGTFEAQVDYPSGDGPRGVAVADFNGDGDLDLAIPTENSDSVAVLIGGAGATFSAPTAYPVGDAPRGIAVADFTRDGDPDLVTANDQGDGVTIIAGAAGAAFLPPVPLPAGNNPFGVSAGDVNGDGEADIVVANTGSDNISVLLNRTPPDTALASGPQGLTNVITPAFAFGADEPGVTFACRIDAAPFAPCTSPLTTGPLADGAHTFEVRATDPAGNADPTPASRAFTVDATAPDTTIDSGPPARRSGCARRSPSTQASRARSNAGSTPPRSLPAARRSRRRPSRRARTASRSARPTPPATATRRRPSGRSRRSCAIDVRRRCRLEGAGAVHDGPAARGDEGPGRREGAGALLGPRLPVHAQVGPPRRPRPRERDGAAAPGEAAPERDRGGPRDGAARDRQGRAVQIRRAKAPRRATRCLPPGASRPGRC